MTLLQSLNRAVLLDELRRYRRRGRFPLNHELRGRAVPLFIDAHGTPCAVAHLMAISGQGELVRHIASTDNAARVHKLARLPELREWLAAAGLSVDEAARIQPSYCHVSEAEACFCGQSVRTGLGLGTIVGAQMRSVEVSVERLAGDLAAAAAVGDRLMMEGSGSVGERILFSSSSDAGGAVFYRMGGDLVITSDVRCQLNEGTKKRPVSVDTAFEALLARDSSSCVDVLRTDQRDWNQSLCHAGSDGGCGLASGALAGSGFAELTSAAIFAALITYRRLRR